MPALPEDPLHGSRMGLRALGLCALVLAASACSVWQLGEVAPDYVDAASHRGVDVLAFDSDSKILASGGWDGEISLWPLSGEKPERGWQAHDGSAEGLSFYGNQLISGGQDGRLILWSRRAQVLRSVDTGSGIAQLQVLNARAITGHYDGSVRAWTLPAFDKVMHLDLHGNDPLAALAVDAGSRRIASSGYDGRVFIIEHSGEHRELQRPPMDAVSLSFVPGRDVLYGGGWVRLYRWDLAGDGFESLSTPHWGAIAALQYLPGEKVLASVSRINDSSVFFLDPLTGEGVRHFQRQSLCGSAVRVSPDERYLAVTGDDGVVRIWDLASSTRQ